MKRAIALGLAGWLLAGGLPGPTAVAQTQPPTQTQPQTPPAAVMPPTLEPLAPLTAEQQWLLLHFSAEYTNTMIIGLIAGGLVGNLVLGGVPATLIGGVAGASIGSFWFYHRLSEEYRVTHPDSSHVPFIGRAPTP